MFFHLYDARYIRFIILLTVLNNTNAAVDLNNNSNLEQSVFNFHNIEECDNNEYYDLNYFTCVPCDRLGNQLRPSEDKFSCVCTLSNITDMTVYETANHQFTMSCINFCQNIESMDISNGTQQAFDKLCQTSATLKRTSCKYKYLNYTKSSYTSSRIESSFVNHHYDGKCNECDPLYNFHYQDYCIANELMRPYLNYYSYWPTMTQRSGELKFVAFFCLSLHNNTACNNLANLCVSSFYSLNKNSPCYKFLLIQATQTTYQFDEASQKELKPFLFYRRGKYAANLLNKPIEGLNFTYGAKAKESQQLSLFNTIQVEDGRLMEWGSLKLWQLNLCYNFMDGRVIQFAKPFKTIECLLSLEQLIDLAVTRYEYRKFFNLYLQHTKAGKQHLYAIPVLINNLIRENQLPIFEDWLLVKRFLLIELQPRYNTSPINNDPLAKYNNSHYLTLYRSLHYADQIQLHYVIYDNNIIAIPLMKLNYRKVEFVENLTLDSLLPFQFSVHFRYKRVDDTGYTNAIVLSSMLIVSIIIVLIRSIIVRQRYVALPSKYHEVFFQMRTYVEFLLEMMGFSALTLILYSIIYVWLLSLKYYTQQYVEIMLPSGSEEQKFLKWTIYVMTLLQFFYVFIKFYRLSHSSIYIIDWERPRCGDTNHWSFKNNLETSSVCSSVRTFIGDNTVSAWRSILVANKWIKLSDQQRVSYILQYIMVYAIFTISTTNSLTHNDVILNLFIITTSFVIMYVVQCLWNVLVVERVFLNPAQQFVNLCSQANISLFILIDANYGFYIHGRSPLGFTDTDMPTLLTQSQSVFGRGLLGDNDQCFIIMPPRNLSRYLAKLHSFMSYTGHTEDIGGMDIKTDKVSIVYSSIKRFFCAFIDHGIKDMDYIIKERTLLERFFNCELDPFLTESVHYILIVLYSIILPTISAKGTFYTDSNQTFEKLWFSGNELKLFWLNLSTLLTIYLISDNFLLAIIMTYMWSKIFQGMYRLAVKQNVSHRTLIKKEYLN